VAEIALDNLDNFPKLEAYRTQIETALKTSHPKVIINGEDAPRVANTTSLTIEGFDSSTLLMSLDLEGISVSAGSACSSGSMQASHVLKAMGATDSQAKSGLRISSGWATTQGDIDAFIKSWTKIIQRLAN